jgi:hypothetical protein
MASYGYSWFVDEKLWADCFKMCKGDVKAAAIIYSAELISTTLTSKGVWDNFGHEIGCAMRAAFESFPTNFDVHNTNDE